MSDVSYVLVFFTNSFLQFYCFGLILLSISQGNYRRRYNLLFQVIAATIATALNYLLVIFHFNCITTINLILLFLHAKLIFKLSFSQTMCFTTLSSAFFIILDLLSLLSCVACNLAVVSFDAYLSSIVALTVQTIFCMVLTPSIYRILRFTHSLNINELSISSLYSFVPFMLLCLFFAATPTTTLTYLNNSASESFLGYIIFTKILFLTFSYITLSNFKIIFLNESQLKCVGLDNERLQTSIDKIKIFKHDYINTMAAISGYITLNDINGLKKFFQKVSKELNDLNTLQSINLESINNPSIFGIIATKFKVAQSDNIKFNFYSTFDYTKINMPTYEFSRVLGILLDNAIENARNSVEKEIYLSMEIKDNNCQLLTIKNSYSNKDVDINSIYKKGYSSKKIKSGIGLWEVKSIIDTMPSATLYTTKSPTYFTQTITMIPNFKNETAVNTKASNNVTNNAYCT